MIQRVQSVYLAIVVALTLLMFFIPFSVIIVPHADPLLEKAIMLKLAGIISTTHGKAERIEVPYWLIALVSVITVLALASLFMFKNRSKQMLFCKINMVLICLLAVGLFWMEDGMSKDYNGKLTYLVGSYIPVIQLVLTFLAERAIKKDDELVRSADRLR